MRRYYGYDYDAAPDPGMRAADADREATADRLRQDHSEGRIDMTEFQERLDRAYQAKTFGELRQLVSDLPHAHHPGPLRPGPRRRPVWMLPWVPLVLLVVALSAVTGHHHPGLWVLIPLLFVARFLLAGRRAWDRNRHRSPQL